MDSTRFFVESTFFSGFHTIAAILDVDSTNRCVDSTKLILIHVCIILWIPQHVLDSTNINYRFHRFALRHYTVDSTTLKSTHRHSFQVSMLWNPEKAFLWIPQLH